MCQPPKFELPGFETIGTEDSLNLLPKRRPAFSFEDVEDVEVYFPERPSLPLQSRPQAQGFEHPKDSCTEDIQHYNVGQGEQGSAPNEGRIEGPGVMEEGREDPLDVRAVGRKDPLDVDLQELECKLELITLQRSVSAVKCEIFLDYLESQSRRIRTNHVPCPPPVPIIGGRGASPSLSSPRGKSSRQVGPKNEGGHSRRRSCSAMEHLKAHPFAGHVDSALCGRSGALPVHPLLQERSAACGLVGLSEGNGKSSDGNTSGRKSCDGSAFRRRKLPRQPAGSLSSDETSEDSDPLLTSERRMYHRSSSQNGRKAGNNMPRSGSFLELEDASASASIRGVSLYKDGGFQSGAPGRDVKLVSNSGPLLHTDMVFVNASPDYNPRKGHMSGPILHNDLVFVHASPSRSPKRRPLRGRQPRQGESTSDAPHVSPKLKHNRTKGLPLTVQDSVINGSKDCWSPGYNEYPKGYPIPVPARPPQTPSSQKCPLPPQTPFSQKCPVPKYRGRFAPEQVMPSLLPVVEHSWEAQVSAGGLSFTRGMESSVPIVKSGSHELLVDVPGTLFNKGMGRTLQV